MRIANHALTQDQIQTDMVTPLAGADTDSADGAIDQSSGHDADATAASVSWTVLFSESVTAVDAGDFASGDDGTVAGATITDREPADVGTGAGHLGRWPPAVGLTTKRQLAQRNDGDHRQTNQSVRRQPCTCDR